MKDKYYISFLYTKLNDRGYGSFVYSNTKKELTMEELEKIIAKEMKVDSIVILNILPFQLKGEKI